MEECKPISTPMEIGCNLCADDEALDVDQNIYRSIIEKLLYLTTSRPNIMLVVRLVARYQLAPKKIRLLGTKKYIQTFVYFHKPFYVRRLVSLRCLFSLQR